VVCIFQHVILERKGGEVVDGELDGGNYVWTDESVKSCNYFDCALFSRVSGVYR